MVSNTSSVLLLDHSSYNAVKCKQCASIYWIIDKAYNGDIPGNLKQPYYYDNSNCIDTSQTGGVNSKKLKPQVVAALSSAELYALCLSNIYSDPSHKNLSHASIIQFLARKGVSTCDSVEGIFLTETALMNTSPLRINSHITMIDALMTLYSRHLVTNERIHEALVALTLPSQSALDPDPLSFLSCGSLSFSNCVQSKCPEIDRLLFMWLNSAAQRYKFECSHYDCDISVPFVKDWSDLCDGIVLLCVLALYLPSDSVDLKQAVFSSPVSFADSTCNLSLFRQICIHLFSTSIVCMSVEDLLYMDGVFRLNILSMLAELFHSLITVTSTQSDQCSTSHNSSNCLLSNSHPSLQYTFSCNNHHQANNVNKTHSFSENRFNGVDHSVQKDIHVTRVSATHSNQTIAECCLSESTTGLKLSASSVAQNPIIVSDMNLSNARSLVILDSGNQQKHVYPQAQPPLTSPVRFMFDGASMRRHFDIQQAIVSPHQRTPDTVSVISSPTTPPHALHTTSWLQQQKFRQPGTVLSETDHNHCTKKIAACSQLFDSELSNELAKLRMQLENRRRTIELEKERVERLLQNEQFQSSDQNENLSQQLHNSGRWRNKRRSYTESAYLDMKNDITVDSVELMSGAFDRLNTTDKSIRDRQPNIFEIEMDSCASHQYETFIKSMNESLTEINNDINEVEHKERNLNIQNHFESGIVNKSSTTQPLERLQCATTKPVNNFFLHNSKHITRISGKTKHSSPGKIWEHSLRDSSTCNSMSSVHLSKSPQDRCTQKPSVCATTAVTPRLYRAENVNVDCLPSPSSDHMSRPMSWFAPQSDTSGGRTFRVHKALSQPSVCDSQLYTASTDCSHDVPYSTEEVHSCQQTVCGDHVIVSDVSNLHHSGDLANSNKKLYNEGFVIMLDENVKQNKRCLAPKSTFSLKSRSFISKQTELDSPATSNEDNGMKSVDGNVSLIEIRNSEMATAQKQNSLVCCESVNIECDETNGVIEETKNADDRDVKEIRRNSGVGLIIGHDLTSPRHEVLDEMERKKEKILMMSLKRKQDIEEARRRKEDMILKKKEKHSLVEAEKQRKKDEIRARKEKIFEQYKLKKALEEDTEKNSKMDSFIVPTIRQRYNSRCPSKSMLKSRAHTVIDNKCLLDKSSLADGNHSLWNSHTNIHAKSSDHCSSTVNLTHDKSTTLSRHFKHTEKRDRSRESSVPPSKSFNKYSSTFANHLYGSSGIKSRAISSQHLCGGFASTHPIRCSSARQLGDTLDFSHTQVLSGPTTLETVDSDKDIGNPSMDSGAGSSFEAISRRNLHCSEETTSDNSSLASCDNSGLRLFKKPVTKSNRSIMLNAIEYCVFPGAVNTDSKRKVINELAACDAKHFLILFRNSVFQFRAIYWYDPDTVDVVRLYGTGPKQVTDSMFDKFFKYNSSGKCFTEIHTKHISATIDAFTVNDTLWQKRRPIPYKKS